MSKTASDNKHTAAEATESMRILVKVVSRRDKQYSRSHDSRRPEHQRTDTVDAQANDECPSITKSAHDTSRVCEGANEIGTEVCSLESSRHSLANAQCGLKMSVQNI